MQPLTKSIMAAISGPRLPVVCYERATGLKADGEHSTELAIYMSG
jgi:hypothetical protein